MFGILRELSWHCLVVHYTVKCTHIAMPLCSRPHAAHVAAARLLPLLRAGRGLGQELADRLSYPIHVQSLLEQ